MNKKQLKDVQINSKAVRIADFVLRAVILIIVILLIFAIMSVVDAFAYESVDFIDLEIRFANVFAYRFDGYITVTLYNEQVQNGYIITLNQQLINGGAVALSVLRNTTYDVNFDFLSCAQECLYCLVAYSVVDRDEFLPVSTLTTGDEATVVNWTFQAVDGAPSTGGEQDFSNGQYIELDECEISTGSSHGGDIPNSRRIAEGTLLFIAVWESVANQPYEPTFQNFFGRYFGDSADPNPGTIWASQVSDSIRRFIEAGGGTAEDWDIMSPHDRFMQSLYWDIAYGMKRSLAWEYIANDFYRFLGGFDMIARFVSAGRGNLYNMVGRETQLAYNRFMYWQRQLLIDYGSAYNFMDGHLHIEDALLALNYEAAIDIDSEDSVGQRTPIEFGSRQIITIPALTQPPLESNGSESFLDSIINSLRNMWLTLTIIVIGGGVCIFAYLRRRSLYIRPNKLD